MMANARDTSDYTTDRPEITGTVSGVDPNGSRHSKLYRRGSAIGTAILGALVFMSLMGIGGLALAWFALGGWLALVAIVTRLAPRSSDSTSHV